MEVTLLQEHHLLPVGLHVVSVSSSISGRTESHIPRLQGNRQTGHTQHRA